MPGIPQNVQVPLSLFGGLDTELSPQDLPEGVSPANNDVVYLPGSVATRPGLQKLYTALGGSPVPSVTYIKTLVASSGNKYNLLLDSLGNLWVEDITKNPGALTQIGSVTPGSYGKSATVFGREYIGFSNGVSGTDYPLLVDEETIAAQTTQRITQDGPGSAPTVADLIDKESISSITATSVPVTSMVVSINSETFDAVVTATTGAVHNLAVGMDVVVAGVSRAQLNGTVTVTGVPSSTTFTYSISIPTIAVSGAVRNTNQTQLASLLHHNLVVGDTVMVQGGQDGVMCGSQTVLTIVSPTQWKYNNPGTNNNPAPAGMSFTATTLSNATGGVVYSGATMVLQTAAPDATPGDPLIIAGAEASDGSFPYDNNVGNNPASWNILTVSSDKTTITFSLLGILNLTATNGSTNVNAGTATIGGQSSQGQYSCVAFFIDNKGTFSRPSPPCHFTSNGNAKFNVSYTLNNIPASITQCGFAFTGSGGTAYFFVPQNVLVPNVSAGGQQLVISATVVPVTNGTVQSSAVFNVSDNTLFAAEGIDIPGNDLFAQRILGQAIGFGSYSGRALCWGEQLQVDNLLNMGFDGGASGVNTPAGWTPGDSRGSLVTAGAKYGNGWRINCAGGSTDGIISQSAFQDAFNVPIITAQQYNNMGGYFFKCYLNLSATGASGSITAAIAGITASISLASYTGPGYYTAQFTGILSLNSAAVLSVYAASASPGIIAIIDDCQILFGIGNNSIANRAGVQFSYVENPGAFDAATGPLIAQDDSTQVQAVAQLRDSLVIFSGGVHTTTAQVSEPSNWPISTVTLNIGSMGPFSVDSGRTGSGDSATEWLIFITDSGMYIYYGAEPIKISQEVQPSWDQLNTVVKQTSWIKADVQTRRIYAGLPVGAGLTPNRIFVLDYRELNTAEQLAGSGPIRISFTGKMIASDLSRKWTYWNLSMNCAQEIALDSNTTAMAFGTGNGGALNSGNCTGNVYKLNVNQFHDDDFGVIQSSYNTYFFVNHEQEQMLGLGSGRKVLKQASVFVAGTGLFSVQAFADSLDNPWPAFSGITLLTQPLQDIAIGFNVSAERVSIGFSALPPAGQLDCYFNLNKLVVLMRLHPMAPTSGSVL